CIASAARRIVTERREDDRLARGALGYEGAVDGEAEAAVELHQRTGFDGQRLARRHVDVANDRLRGRVGEQGAAAAVDAIEDVSGPAGGGDAVFEPFECQRPPPVRTRPPPGGKRSHDVSPGGVKWLRL